MFHPRPVQVTELSPFPKLRRWRWVMVFIVGVSVVAVIVLGTRLGWTHLLETTLAWLREAGPFAFFGAMAILPAVGFPLLPFTVAAGPAFGPTLGIETVVFCSILAVVVNVALSYGIAWRWLAPLAEKRRWPLPRFSTRLTFPLMLLLRITPGIPFWMQSYLLGILRAPFGLYMAVSTLVPALYITGTVLGSTAALQGRKSLAIVAFAGIFAVGAALHFMRRRQTRDRANLKTSN